MCPREKDRRVLQENFAYASAARRRTYGDGGGDGDSGASLHLRRLAHIFVYALACDCSHFIGRDFNATIKHRLAGRIKEINGKYDRTAASTAATTASPAAATPTSAATYKATRNNNRAQFSALARTNQVDVLPLGSLRIWDRRTARIAKISSRSSRIRGNR